jgi:MFS family permease
MDNANTIKRISLPLMLISLPLTVMSVLLPMYTSELGLTPIQVTGLFSVFSLGLVVMRLFIGYISDKVGRKPVFALGLIFYALSYMIYFKAKIILLIYLGRGLQAMGAAFISISTYSMIADLNMKSNAHNFGKIDSYSQKGGLIGVILCFFALNTPELTDGWSNLFFVCSICAVIAVIYAIAFLNETKPMNKIESFGISLPGEKNKIIAFNMIICIFTSIVSSIFVLYLQKRFDSNLLEIGIAFLLPTVVIAFTSPSIGRVSDRIGNKKAMIISLIMVIITLLILPYTSNVYLFGVIWTIYCIGLTLLSVTLDSVYVQDISEEIRGVAIGKLTMGANIGTVVGPIIGGLVFQEISIQIPFIISSIGFFLLLLSYMKYKKDRSSIEDSV